MDKPVLKLPVLPTVRRAYSFAFGNLGTIFRLCWFPLLISALPWPLPTAGALATSDDLWWSGGAVSLAIGIVVALVKVFCLSMALVALHRAILFNERRPTALVPFSVGRAEFLFAAVAIVFQVAGLGLVLTLRPSFLGFRLGHTASFALFVAAIVGVFAAVRLLPLYPAIVVTERLALREAWRLSQGNFWRIVGASIACALPTLLLPSQIAFVASQVGDPQLTLPGSEDNVALVRTWATATVGFFISIPLTALGVGLLCYTYKALAGFAPDEVVPSEGHRR